MTRLISLFFALIFATSVNAQIYPDVDTTRVNDFASIIDAETEARIDAQLSKLASETGSQVTVATLSSVAFYASDMPIAEYATNLFNEWGVGGDDNDGILLMVFKDDRELRLVTGSGFGDGYDRVAQGLINSDILPKFRDGDFGAGVEAGTLAIEAKVIRPFHAGEEVSGFGFGAVEEEPATEGKGGGLWWILGLIGAPIVALFGWSKMKAAKLAKTPCPSCGKTGLRKERVVVSEATETAAGKGEMRTICDSCGHTEADEFIIPRKKTEAEKAAEAKGEIKGGESKGGGAGGKW